MTIFNNFKEKNLKDIHLKMEQNEGIISLTEDERKLLYSDIILFMNKNIKMNPLRGRDINLEYDALVNIFIEIIDKRRSYRTYFNEYEISRIENCIYKSKTLENLSDLIKNELNKDDFELIKYKYIRKIDSIKNNIIMNNYELLYIAKEISKNKRIEIKYLTGETVVYWTNSDVFKNKCIGNIISNLGINKIGVNNQRRVIELIKDSRGGIIVDFKDVNKYAG